MIEGPGANLVTVSGNHAVGVFAVGSSGPNVTATISGLTITGGSAGFFGGGGLDNYGTLSLTDCTVSANSAEGGGGLFNNGGTLSLTDCTVSANSAGSFGGGGIDNGGTMTLTDCTISGNSAGSFGGGGLTITAAACSGSPTAPSPPTRAAG